MHRHRDAMLQPPGEEDEDELDQDEDEDAEEEKLMDGETGEGKQKYIGYVMVAKAIAYLANIFCICHIFLSEYTLINLFTY